MADPGPIPAELEAAVRMALDEDIGTGDATTRALIGADVRAHAEFRFREAGVVAGVPAARAALLALDADASFEQLVPEGARAEAGAVVARAEGLARAVLAVEGVSLNFMARLSGIATLTARFVEAAASFGVAILDTRKTTPGLRALEKYAARAGGGVNHRMGLDDAVLVKDNHLAVAGLTPEEAVSRAKAAAGVPVEVEVTGVEAAVSAARAGADIVMLDNFTPAEAARAVAAVRAEFTQVARAPSGADPSSPRGAPAIEVSGGISLDNVRDYAAAGPDRISVGALTHSARALDVTLDVTRLG